MIIYYPLMESKVKFDLIKELTIILNPLILTGSGDVHIYTYLRSHR